LKRSNYSTDVDITPLKKSGKQLYWMLSYGPQVDKRYMDKIKNALGSFAEKN